MLTATLPAPTATTHCTNTACLEATTHRDLCECSHCDGEGHGLAFMTAYDRERANMAARIEKSGGVFAMLGAAGGLASDDNPFGAF